MASSRSIRTILEKLEESLNIACEQLSEETPNRENADFDKDVFWANFSGATKLVSHEATKFCLAFGKEPLPSPEECQILANKIEESCLALLTVFFSLPKSKGRTLHKEIRLYSLYVLRAIKDLCTAAKNQSRRQLQNVGNVWEKCEAVENLPKDNRDAVLALCQEEHDMVQDASQELLDAYENEDEMPDLEFSLVTPRNGIRIPPVRTWTDSDRNVILPCSGLVKATKACIKKTLHAISERGDGNDERSISELDGIAEIVKSSSALVDDFVLSLYPPVNHSAVRHQASLVRTNSKDLLTYVGNSHFFSEADATWIEFLRKAIDHNWVKINDMVLAD